MGWHYRVAGQRPALPTAVSPQTKSPDQGRGFLLYLVPEIGIEPTTYALRMRPTESGGRFGGQEADCMSTTPRKRTGMHRCQPHAVQSSTDKLPARVFRRLAYLDATHSKFDLSLTITQAKAKTLAHEDRSSPLVKSPISTTRIRRAV